MITEIFSYSQLCEVTFPASLFILSLVLKKAIDIELASKRV